MKPPSSYLFAVFEILPSLDLASPISPLDIVWYQAKIKK
jgi:hypothetical protein